MSRFKVTLAAPAAATSSWTAYPGVVRLLSPLPLSVRLVLFALAAHPTAPLPAHRRGAPAYIDREEAGARLADGLDRLINIPVAPRHCKARTLVVMTIGVD